MTSPVSSIVNGRERTRQNKYKVSWDLAYLRVFYPLRIARASMLGNHR